MTERACVLRAEKTGADEMVVDQRANALVRA